MSLPLDNKRIIKNTFALYFRQIITMCVGLYTSRVILNQLGVTDFGINTVVGGLVLICSFISGAFVQTLNRYFSYELGREDYEKLNKLFNISLVIYAFISLLFIILAETIGLWFLLNKMVMPPERVEAAFWVFEFSILQMVLGLINTPYISIVISRERFKLFAYMSIFDAVARLAVVYLLVIVNYDKLKLFSVLNFAVSCLTFIIYQKYCRSNFKETKYKFCREWPLYKDLFKFSGWVLLNPVSYTAKYQGVNMVLNLFFGPIINAANGIAAKVAQAISSFSENAAQAVNPQIIKLYATKNFTEMWNLVIRASKMYYLLFFILTLPVIVNAEFVLKFWLVNVPDYAVIFTQLVLVEQIIRVLLLASIQVNNASGNIKMLQIVGCIVQSSNLPAAIVLCYLKINVISIFIAGIVIMALFVFFVLLIVNIQNNLPVFRFLRELFLPIVIVTILTLITPIAMYYSLPDNALFSFINIIVCIIFGCGISYCFGLNKNERDKILRFIKIKIGIKNYETKNP
jgi:O-antigen/teichoic acid export membrane protein